MRRDDAPFLAWNGVDRVADFLFRVYMEQCRDWAERHPGDACAPPATAAVAPGKAVADRQEPGDTNWWFTVEDQVVPCFAGLWKVDQDHDRVYAFCTTEPNPLVTPKHPKAMPVILLAEDQERWLTAPVEEALSLLTAYPSQLMSIA